MGVAGGGRGADLTEDDDPGRASIDTECATGAHVVVDGEDERVVRVVAGFGDAVALLDTVDGLHVDAFPRADVDAAFAGDALGLVDVDELLRLHGPAEIVGVDLHQEVVGPEFR